MEQDRITLLVIPKRPTRRTWRWVALAAILSVACAVIVLACVYVMDVTGSGAEQSGNSSPLNGILSKSFRAEMVVSRQYKDPAGNFLTTIEIEWDTDTHDFRYQETRRGLTDKLAYTDDDSRFVYADNAAVFGVLLGEKTRWFCHEDVDSIEWFTVFQIMLQKKVRAKDSDMCPGDEWQATVADHRIVFCVEHSRLVYIYNREVRAFVTEWSTPSHKTIAIPHSYEHCRATFTNISQLEEKFASSTPVSLSSDTSSSATQPMKHCLFVHGAGEHPSTDRYLDLKTLPTYWGDMERYTPQCQTRRFIWYNSIYRGWDDTESHRMFCEFATHNKSTEISNSIIFSHSMGNLVVAAAFHRKICTFDEKSSIWYAIQAPWRGTRVSDVLPMLCADKCLPTKITYRVLRLLHYCKPHSDLPSTAYISLQTTYISPTGISYDDMIKIARKYISGAVCGTSALGMGLSWSVSARMLLVALYTKLDTPNDGLVPFDSCCIKGIFNNSVSSRYYKGEFNHAEGTCRFGEGKGFLKSQHPCLWYSK